jgi:acyl-CoA synthetase (AMP-forming)/AMP-acid ligase II
VSANVVQLFFAAARAHAEDPAFVSSRGAQVRFGELRDAVEAFAGGLAERGLAPGDRAVFMLPMSPELYVAVLGTLTAGGVAVFVDPWVSVRQIARLAAAAQPVAFIGTPKSHLLRLTAPALRKARITVSTGGVGASLVARDRFRGLRGTARIASVSDDASALITYTTGSSGAPKGVNRTHAILGAQHHVIRQEFPAQRGDVDMTTFPVFALSNLAAGVTTVIPPVDLRRIGRADADAVLRDIREFGVTTIAASPPLFDRVATQLQRTGASAPPVRRIVTGGAPVRDDQLALWRRAFPSTEIVVAYGSSEAEPVASMTAEARLAVADAQPGFCAGTPVQAVRTRVVRIVRGPIATPEPVEHGDIGELIVAGPHVCRDYSGDERAFRENKIRDADGTVWHRMGDTGHFDDAGRFWIAGRVHSTIRRQRVDVHPQLIEREIGSYDSRIRRVAAVGLPDPSLGERLVVVIESDTQDVGSEIRKRLVTARTFVPVDELIVTGASLPVDPRHNSKIDYPRLRAMLERGELR